EPLRVLAGGRHHQQAQPRSCHLGIPAFDDRQRILDVRAAPAGTGAGNLEIAAWRRLAAADADARRRNVEAAAGLVFAEHAGDVVVDHDHFVDVPEPLPREDSDRRRAAADAHALLVDAVDARHAPGLDGQLRAALDLEIDGLAIAELHHQLAGHAALLLGAPGQVMHAAQ